MSKDNLSPIISVLRFPLALMVVFIHSFGQGECDLSNLDLFNITTNDTYNIIRTFISKVICQVAVPLFFFFSGYLFFKKLENWNLDIYKNKIHSRIYTLLIPYLSWNIIRYFSNVCLNNAPQDFSLINFWHTGYFDSGYINWLGTHISMSHPLHVPFWYLRDLIILVILSPLIYFLIKRIGNLFITFILFCYISSFWPTIPGQSICSVFFFCIGAFICIKKFDLISYISKLKHLVYIVYGVLSIVLTFAGSETEVRKFLYPVFILSACCSILLLFKHVNWQNPIYKLTSDSTFFIYAFHMILLNTINPLFTCENTIEVMIKYLITPIIVALISVPLFYIINH